SYTIWGLGDFSSIPMSQIPFFCGATLVGLLAALLLIKPLNALLLGERYAANLGVNVRLIRICLLLCTGWLTAIVTAYCGPIAFIGLAVPHIARLLLRSSNHSWVLPATMLSGSAVALACNFLCVLPGGWGIIPLNAVTPLFGAPVIIYILVNQRKIQYFN
ncbi:MAG: iron ABC transporter permease, partial [Porphyromonadaceae bacterium]|nr:iron ABC transporter permease [Porphyromonadaceae bacterium]